MTDGQPIVQKRTCPICKTVLTIDSYYFHLMEEMVLGIRNLSAHMETLTSRFDEFMSYMQDDEFDERERLQLLELEKIKAKEHENDDTDNGEPAIEQR